MNRSTVPPAGRPFLATFNDDLYGSYGMLLGLIADRHAASGNDSDSGNGSALWKHVESNFIYFSTFSFLFVPLKILIIMSTPNETASTLSQYS